MPNGLRTQLFIVLLSTALWSSLATGVSAQARETSLLTYGADGLINGGLVGLSIGYLSTGGDFQSGEWRNLAYGTAIGSIVGIGAGAVLALSDATNDTARGAVVLRDMRYGAILGTVAGSLVGLLVFIDSEDGGDILGGSAIGALSGSALGLVYGILDPLPPRLARGERTDQRPVHFTFAAAPTANGDLLVVGTAAGQF